MRGFKQYIIEEHGYQPPQPKAPGAEHRFDKMVRQIREQASNPSSKPTTTLKHLRAPVSDTSSD